MISDTAAVTSRVDTAAAAVRTGSTDPSWPVEWDAMARSETSDGTG